MIRRFLLMLACSGIIYYLATIILISLAAWLGIDASLFVRIAPYLVPGLCTAGVVIALTNWMRPRGWIAVDILAGGSMVFIMFTMASLGLGGFLEVHGHANEASKLLGSAVISGVIAIVLFVVDACVVSCLAISRRKCQ